MQSFQNGLCLEGSQIRLRPSTPKDYSELKAILNDHQTMEVLFDYFKVREWTDQMVFDRYEGYRLQQREGRLVDFVVVLKNSGRIVGNCGFNNIDMKNLSAEFGLILHRSVWGHGISKDCHKICLTYGFEKIGLEQIYFMTGMDNFRMRRFFDKMEIPLVSEVDKICRYEIKKSFWSSVLSLLSTIGK